MSADNGVYILETLAADGIGKEYRVTEAGAIENLYYDVGTGEHRDTFVPEIAYQYFCMSPIFREEKDALIYAEQLAKGCVILEYGICHLSHPDEMFQTFTEEQIEFFEAEVEATILRHRKKREATLAQKRAEATVVPEPGDRFEPVAIYGYYITPSGEKQHGTLFGVENLPLVEGLTFLPTGWAERNEE